MKTLRAACAVSCIFSPILRSCGCTGRMPGVRFRLLYVIASVLLVLSGAWNLRSALAVKTVCAARDSLHPVVTVSLAAQGDIAVFHTQKRSMQLTERKKERRSLLQLGILLTVVFCALLPHGVKAFAVICFLSLVFLAFTKYKSVITFLQTLL